MIFQWSVKRQCVLFYSVAKSCLTVTSWKIACQGPLSSISQNFFKFISIESVMLSNHLILCHPLLLLPSVFSSIRIFYMLAKWNFSYKIASSQFWFFYIALTIKTYNFSTKLPKLSSSKGILLLKSQKSTSMEWSENL